MSRKKVGGLLSYSFASVKRIIYLKLKIPTYINLFVVLCCLQIAYPFQDKCFKSFEIYSYGFFKKINFTFCLCEYSLVLKITSFEKL